MGYAWGDVVSNFANEKNSNCKPFPIQDNMAWEVSFTTGSFAGGYKIDQVYLSVVSAIWNSSASEQGGKFRVQIWDSAGSNPGSLIDPLVGPAITVAQGDNLKPGIMSYSSFGATLLNPNTTYWVVTTVVGGNDLSVTLEPTDNHAETSNPAGWSIGDYSLIKDSDGTVSAPDQCIPYLKITAVPVPEPSTMALLGLTGAGLAFLARRRK
jgi:hypothetical protein